jgi:hypothetical protein
MVNYEGVRKKAVLDLSKAFAWRYWGKSQNLLAL